MFAFPRISSLQFFSTPPFPLIYYLYFYTKILSSYCWRSSDKFPQITKHTTLGSCWTQHCIELNSLNFVPDLSNLTCKIFGVVLFIPFILGMCTWQILQVLVFLISWWVVFLLALPVIFRCNYIWNLVNFLFLIHNNFKPTMVVSFQLFTEWTMKPHVVSILVYAGVNQKLGKSWCNLTRKWKMKTNTSADKPCFQYI